MSSGTFLRSRVRREWIPQFRVLAALHQPVAVLGKNLRLWLFFVVSLTSTTISLGMRYREIRLSGHAHRESLRLRGRVQLAFTILVDWNFAQAGSGTIWRDDPKIRRSGILLPMTWAAAFLGPSLQWQSHPSWPRPWPHRSRLGQPGRPDKNHLAGPSANYISHCFDGTS